MQQVRSRSAVSPLDLEDSLISFVHNHDNLPVFQAAYLVGAFLASLIFNLGFFLVLVTLHIALDTAKYRTKFGFSFGNSLRHAFVESLFDICLFFVALALMLYLNQSYGLIAMSGIARTELTLVRALGTVGPKMQILRDTLQSSLHFTGHSFTAAEQGSIKLTRMQQLMIGVTLAAVVALAYAPFSYASRGVDLPFVLYHNLVPWVL